MRITEEYIEDRIAFAEKNLAYSREKGYENLALLYEGEVMAWTECKFRKMMCGSRICWVGMKKGIRRRLVILLSRWLDKLKGVENGRKRICT